MSSSYNEQLRSILRKLNKGDLPDYPLFIPTMFSVAFQIEAIDAREFCANPTKVSKGISELSGALEFGVVTPVVPCLSEAEALGRSLDWNNYPPAIKDAGNEDIVSALGEASIEKMLLSDRVAVSIESTKRLKATLGRNAVIVAGLTGPATLARQLVGDRFSSMAVEEIVQLMEFCGRSLAAYTRALGEAGTQAFLISEAEPLFFCDGLSNQWADCVRPIINVAKFHRSVVVIKPESPDIDVLNSVMALPLPGALWCAPIEVVDSLNIRPAAVSVSADTGSWPVSCSGYSVVVSRDEVPRDTTIPQLKSALEVQLNSFSKQ